MKTKKPAPYATIHPVPGDHDHISKLEYDLATSLVSRLNAAIDLLQLPATAQPWQDNAFLSAATAFRVRDDLAEIRRTAQSLKDKLGRTLTRYDYVCALYDAIMRNTDRLDLMSMHEDETYGADQILHDMLKGKTDW